MIPDCYAPCANGTEVLRRLGAAPEQCSSILAGWGDSFINMPSEIFFLQKETLEELQNFFFISEGVMAKLHAAAAAVEKNPDLKAYVWHFYYRLVSFSFSSGASHAGFADWYIPELPSVMTTAVCGVLHDAVARYRKEGFADNVIRDTLKVYTENFEKQYLKGEEPFVLLNAVNWMRVYLAARLVQLGRFNFKLMETFPFGVVLQHKNSKVKVLLSQPGVSYDASGFVCQENAPEEEDAWTSLLEENHISWYGNPVSPYGFALKTPRTFPKEEWECILAPGDIMIDMHIPSGGGMTPEKALDSFRQAASFFQERYPGRFKKVFICHSWIFNTQFEEKLPSSNLAKLMKECYLFPHPSSGRDGMFFLFGRDYEDLSLAPRDTSQRRAMLEILESGKRLRTGGMLLFAEDLPRFGTQCYRKDLEGFLQ